MSHSPVFQPGDIVRLVDHPTNEMLVPEIGGMHRVERMFGTIGLVIMQSLATGERLPFPADRLVLL